MKRFLLIFSLLIGLSLSISAKNQYYRDDSVLPAAAKNTISNNFKSKIILIKINKKLGMISDYDVILSDGSEINFDKNGNWKEIEVPNNKTIPNGFIPTGVKEYIKKNHSGAKIVGIEKENNGIEVEISTGITMKFDNGGKFLRYDK